MDEATDAFPQLAVWAAEVAELDAALAPLCAADWMAVTPFKDWRVRDHVVHLYVSDLLARDAAADPEGFLRRRDGGAAKTVVSPRSFEADDVLETWRGGISTLREVLAPIDPRQRLPWFGPDMSARAFVTARQMETWAHGQTIHDTLGLRRVGTTRLRPICDFGWRTFGWSFRVHRLEPPAAPVILRLTGPSGDLWTWGEADAPNSIEGAAEEFALVVCQCRNVADTGLKVEGPVAAAWMAIAQCFAGGPADPPPPGLRASRRETSLP